MQDKIFFILQNGFRQISLPNEEVINITSCDGGCFLTTERDLKESEVLLNKYIGLPIYYVCCDENYIHTGTVLSEAKIVKHAPYEFEDDYLYIYDKVVTEDGRIVMVVE